jgi:O-antigen ligase
MSVGIEPRLFPAALGALVVSAGVAFLAAAGAPEKLIVAVSFAFAVAAVASWRATTRARADTRARTARGFAVGLVALGVGWSGANALRPLPGLSVGDVFLLAGGVALLCELVLRREGLRVPTWLSLAGWGLLLATIVSSVPTDSVGSNLVPGLRLTATLALTPLVIGVAAGTEASRDRIAAAWLLGTSLVTATAFLDFLHVTHFWSWLESNPATDPSYNGNRFAGVTAHPNHVGLLGAMGLPFALSYLVDGGRKRRVLGVAAVASLELGVLVSGSRAALLGSAFAFVVWAWLGRRRVLRTIFWGGALLLVAVVATSIFASGNLLVGGDRLGGNSATRLSDAGRWVRVDVAAHQFVERPILGVGFANVRAAHDIYLQLLSAGGVVALACFALFVLGTLRIAVRRPAAGGALARQVPLVAASAAGLLTWLFVGVAQNALYDRYLYVPAGLLLSYALASREATAPRSAESTLDWWRPAALSGGAE